MPLAGLAVGEGLPLPAVRQQLVPAGPEEVDMSAEGLDRVRSVIREAIAGGPLRGRRRWWPGGAGWCCTRPSDG